MKYYLATRNDALEKLRNSNMEYMVSILYAKSKYGPLKCRKLRLSKDLTIAIFDGVIKNLSLSDIKKLGEWAISLFSTISEMKQLRKGRTVVKINMVSICRFLN